MLPEVEGRRHPRSLATKRPIFVELGLQPLNLDQVFSFFFLASIYVHLRVQNPT